MPKEFQPLVGAPGTPDVSFEPVDKRAPAGHAMSHMYREVGDTRVWAFLSVDGCPYSFTSFGDSDLMSIAWMRGCIRGIKFLAARTSDATVKWLTPEQYVALGGTFDD